jgi:hypothetical protein
MWKMEVKLIRLILEMKQVAWLMKLIRFKAESSGGLK